MKRISSWGNLFPSCFHLTMKRYSHFDYMGILSFSYFFPFFLYFLYNPPIHCCTSNPSKCHMPSKWCSTWENRRRGSVVAFSGAISPTAGHRQFSPATTTDLPPVASLRAVFSSGMLQRAVLPVEYEQLMRVFIVIGTLAPQSENVLLFTKKPIINQQKQNCHVRQVFSARWRLFSERKAITTYGSRNKIHTSIHIATACLRYRRASFFFLIVMIRNF